MKRNHFISVSRTGDLMARRSGEAPVSVATCRDGLEVAVPEERLGLLSIRVFFERHACTPRRHVYVTEVEVAGKRAPVAEFLTHWGVTDAELGRWMRDAVERMLDARLAGR